MSSTLDPSIPPLKPSFTPRADPSLPPPKESAPLATLISTLKLRPHVEGGYFAETDRDPYRVPNPFTSSSVATSTAGAQQTLLDTAGGDGDVLRRGGYAADQSGETRNASTSILYLLTPGTPQGCFHRNRGRTVHTLVKGRGTYVLLHADEVMDGEKVGGKVRVEVFRVGLDVANGERVQWVVEGGKYKASFLLSSGDAEEEGLLVAETVVPGFEFEDHDFLTHERARELLTAEQMREVEWLVRPADAKN